jgi:hypothetical protein
VAVERVCSDPDFAGFFVIVNYVPARGEAEILFKSSLLKEGHFDWHLFHWFIGCWLVG